MTKKRFTHKKWYDDRQLFDGDEPFAIVDVYIQAEAIVNLLNGLDGTIKDLSDDYQQLMGENNELKKENKQLKYQNEMLSDELEQCKAVINKEWSKYLKKKEKEELEE